jgi:hypothetical protein
MRNAKITVALPIIAIVLIGVSAPLSRATETTIEHMPAKLETQFALREGDVADSGAISFL